MKSESDRNPRAPPIPKQVLFVYFMSQSILCMYTYIYYIYIMYTQICIFMCIYIYIHTHTHTHTHTLGAPGYAGHRAQQPAHNFRPQPLSIASRRPATPQRSTQRRMLRRPELALGALSKNDILPGKPRSKT